MSGEKGEKNGKYAQRVYFSEYMFLYSFDFQNYVSISHTQKINKQIKLKCE